MAVDGRLGSSIRTPTLTPRRHRIRISLIGGFELTNSRRQVELSASAERLVALLALHERPLHRHYVFGTLWPETTDDRAAGNLRSSIWRLRRVDPPLLEVTDRHLALRDDVDVDLRDWSELFRRACDPSFDLDDGEVSAVALPADMLPGWYEDWVVVERERFRQVRLHTLEVLCETLVARCRFAAAIEAGLAVLREEPLRESGQRAVIRAFLAEGNRWDAIRQFRRYRDLLRAELGLEPSSALERLIGGA